MNRIVFLLLVVVCISCLDDENYQLLLADSFRERIEKMVSPTIIDVRSPEEYAQGHLLDALNINWNDREFENQVAVLDRNQPVFVYCLSGGRSSKASKKLLAMKNEIINPWNRHIFLWQFYRY